ncbi:MAG: TrkA family potassium uptake protein [Candidatus Aegiribacteria sp.]|nr:TrkA family potassium uptake protein [Candidatus Aegiribacteria sp.]
MTTSGNSQTKCIVCGLGETGICVVRELLEHEFIVSVIDRDPEALERVQEFEQNIAVTEGDCLKDSTLLKAGVPDADVLYSILPDDRSNVFLSLSARRINPRLNIYSVASDLSAEKKLELVGVKRTVNPNNAEGLRISSEMLRPNVAVFLDSIVYAREHTAGYLSISVPQGSPSAGVSLSRLRVQNKTGVVIIAVRRNDNSMVYSPSGDFRVAEGDSLIAFGTEEEKDVVRKLLSAEPDRKHRWNGVRNVFRTKNGRGGRI